MKEKQSPALVVLFNVLVLITVISFFEGAASLALLSLDLYSNRHSRVAEYLHTKYDPELGWVNIPGKTVPDMYGSGKTVSINSQSFRSLKEFSVQIPESKFRILCSGDSYTFGFGVADEDTWCQDLSRINPRVETINMGQGGYGVDQAYLLYMREGRKLDHNAHIFAFIGDDFRRAMTDVFLGYGKPLLKVANNKLITTNVPVPRAAFVSRWLTDNLASFDQLSTLKIIRKIFPPKEVSAVEVNTPLLFSLLFDSLQKQNTVKGSTLILVYLPTRGDVYEGQSAELRNWLRFLCAQKGWNYLDVTDNFMTIPPDARDKLFIQDEAMPGFAHTGGHYTEAGNIFVAEVLYRYLVSMPDISIESNRAR